MNRKSKIGNQNLRTIFRLSRPLNMLLAALTYSFGASIANYLGKAFRLDSLWLGLLAVVLAQMSMSLLSEVFRLDTEPLAENESRRERQMLRNNALYISIASLAADAVIAFILFTEQRLSIASFAFLLFSLFLVLAYSLPPFRNRGFGEFLLAAHIAYVIPSIAYLLQADDTHRFLILTIPLTLLAFAYFIVSDFPSFASDNKFNRTTFLTRLG